MSRGGLRGGGRGSWSGGRPSYNRDAGPPDIVLEMGSFIHAVEGEMLCTSLMTDKVPYFNAPIYLQNKSVIGKVDEILGPINEVYFSVKMGEGMVASSFKQGDRVYIAGDKLLPIERFLPKAKTIGEKARGARGGAGRGRGMSGGRGSRGGGSGFSRRGSRGGFGDRGRGTARFGSNRGSRRGRGGFRSQ
ncbi:Gar1-domain-containing protein [Dentipellis sp. KUC8613]|nr:Gar1-domain-containing protein [Dentipellis sp. KUC8613]